MAVTADDANMRSDPAIASDNIVATYRAGQQLEIVSSPISGADGTIWYRVRNPETAQTGYIAAEFLRPTE